MPARTAPRQRTHGPILGRDELNFAEWPLGGLTSRQPAADVNKLVFADRIPHPQTREPVDRTFTIAPSGEYGFPTSHDDEVILALLQVAKLADFATREISFTRYRLIQLLGWSDQGHSYRRLDQSLRRWMGVTLYYTNAWWCNETKDWVSVYFHILDDVVIPQRRGSPIVVTWNRHVYRSFQSDNLKRLDLTFYFSLEHHGTKRAFRYLDKKFYQRRTWQLPLREFACDHIGLSGNYHTGQLKAKLRPFLAELEDKGYLEPLAPKDRFVKVGRGSWDIILIAKRPTRSIPQPTPVENELTTRGVTAAVAARLANDFDHARIHHKIELFDFYAQQAGQEKPKNPGGWLTKAIQDDYAPPANFKTAAQREAEANQKQTREQAKRDQVRQQEQRRRQEVADSHELFTTWKSIWDALPQDEQQELWYTVWGTDGFFNFRRHRRKHVALEPVLDELRQRQSRRPQQPK